MRVSLIITVLASIIGLTLGQCQTNPTCSTSGNVPVPNPWFGLNFATDPRLNAGVTSPVYGWQLQDDNADSCAAYHQGLLVLGGASFGTLDAGDGPSVNLTQSTGPLSVGSALPGNIGGVGSGSYALATNGWSFEVTFKAARVAQWAKIYDLGNTKINGVCDGDIILGWNDQGPTTNFQTCINGNSNTIGGNPATTNLTTWYHIVAVLQQSPDGRSTYSVYVNGALTTVSIQQQTILRQFRDRAFLGRSSWNDCYWNGSIDTFNIYDVALTPVQITSLYQAEMGGCAITRAANVAPLNPTTPPTPQYAAEFATNISSATTVFGWVQQDPLDVSCGINTRHTGLLTLDGSGVYRPLAGPHVNLAATSGPNFAGTTIPNIGGVTAGAGTIANFSAGFAIEVVFKPWFQNYGGKLFNFGNTPNASAACTPGDFWLGWNSEQFNFQFYVCSGTSTIGVFNALGNGNSPFGLMQWYHVVVSFYAQQNGLATIACYINGNLTQIAQNMYFPQSVARANAFLGKSQFVGGDDTYFSGEYDSFRVYNQALSQAQIVSLAGTALYGSATATSGVSTCPQVANTATTVPASALFYSAAFTTDPRSFAGGTSAANYGWMASDSNDTTPVQQAHTGLILLGYGSGAPNTGRYVNLSATTSSSSIGNPLPQFGGFGTGSYNSATAGWSFELEFKALQTATSSNTDNGQNWAKVVDFGNGNTNGGGSCYNDIVWGFVSNTRTMNFQTCMVQGSQQTLGGTVPTFINWNTWYHVLVSLQLAPGGSLGSLWVNGTLVDQRVLPYYPLYAPRANAQLAKSSWGGDAYFNGEVDMFNIYSQAFNQAQATALYNAANAGGNVPTPASSSSSSSGAPASSPSSSSSASSTGSVVVANATSSSSAVARSSSSVVPVSSSSSASTSTVPVSSSSDVPVSSSSSTGVVASVASSSSSTGDARVPNSASFTVPSMMIVIAIVIFVSMML